MKFEPDLIDLTCDPLPASPFPQVVGSTVDEVKLKIVVDNMTITTWENVSEAIVALVLTHSVFNINFKKKVAPFMFYVQRYVLGIDDGCKAPQKMFEAGPAVGPQKALVQRAALH